MRLVVVLRALFPVVQEGLVGAVVWQDETREVASLPGPDPDGEHADLGEERPRVSESSGGVGENLQHRRETVEMDQCELGGVRTSRGYRDEEDGSESVQVHDLDVPVEDRPSELPASE